MPLRCGRSAPRVPASVAGMEWIAFITQTIQLPSFSQSTCSSRTQPTAVSLASSPLSDATAQAAKLSPIHSTHAYTPVSPCIIIIIIQPTMEHLISDAAAARILKTPARLRASLPEPRKMTILDPHIGILLIALHILALVSPPTRRWRLFRAALAPLIAMTWLWLGYVPVLRTPQERWGSNLLFCKSVGRRLDGRRFGCCLGMTPSSYPCHVSQLNQLSDQPGHFAFRAFEHLVVFTPEFEVYRLRPRAARLTKHHDAKGRQLIHSSTSTASHGHGHEGATLEREAIPEPWTLAKLEWAASLWWSWRGIGWNYAPPLTDSQMGEPYMRTTSRRKHLIHRAIHLAAVYALDDAAASFMRVGMPQFFVTHELKYADLTTWQRAAISIATVTRILGSLEYSHIQVGIMAVAVGGIFGLEGELWEPWGWPAMFGSLGCIWRNPGLNYVWAKVSSEGECFS